MAAWSNCQFATLSISCVSRRNSFSSQVTNGDRASWAFPWLSCRLPQLPFAKCQGHSPVWLPWSILPARLQGFTKASTPTVPLVGVYSDGRHLPAEQNITKGAFWWIFSIRLAPMWYHKKHKSIKNILCPSICESLGVSIDVLQITFINLLLSLPTQQVST